MPRWLQYYSALPRWGAWSTHRCLVSLSLLEALAIHRRLSSFVFFISYFDMYTLQYWNARALPGGVALAVPPWSFCSRAAYASLCWAVWLPCACPLLGSAAALAAYRRLSSDVLSVHQICFFHTLSLTIAVSSSVSNGRTSWYDTSPRSMVSFGLHDCCSACSWYSRRLSILSTSSMTTA